MLPPFLQQGDKIAIISTARKVSPEEVSYALKVLESWGLDPICAPNLFAEYHQFAGTDEQRTADLQWALNDPQIKAIICARGGYGTSRIVDNINFSTLAQNPKWLVGFSDVTILHNHLNKLGIPSIHATMPLLFHQEGGELALDTLKASLFGHLQHYEFSAHAFNRNGEAEGQLIGGNLSLLCHGIGSPSEIDTKGKILFIEDLDEYLYHVDRMMVQLKRAGKLESLAGMVVGGLTDMNDNATPFGKTAYEIVQEHTKEYVYPLAFNLPAGHIPDNRALICGAETRLNVTCEKTFLGTLY